jgi:hypothetical protein
MAEVSAFVYGWLAGIVAVIVWILYGIDTLLRLIKAVNSAFAHLPGLSSLAYAHKEESAINNDNCSSEAATGKLGAGDTSKYNVMPAEEGLEGLTGCTKKVTPITAGGLCLMSWYGPDGTTGAPIECRLALENNEVTIYQLLRVGDSNNGITGTAGNDRLPGAPSGAKGTGARRGGKDCDTNAVRSAAGVTVAEHRKGHVSVLHTTVMELKHFNKPKKNAGDSGEGSGGKSSASRKGGNAAGSDADASTPDGSKHKRKESGSGTGRDSMTGGGSESGGPKKHGTNANDTLVDGVTRPGVDPLFTGRVLIWRTMDGSPLFDSIHAPKPPTGINCLGNSLRRTAGSNESLWQAAEENGGGGGGTHSFAGTRSVDSLSDDRSRNSSLDDGDNSEYDEVHSNFNGSVEELQGSDLNSTNTRGGEAKEHHSHKHYHNGRRRSRKGSDMNDMSNWSCVIIKFERARESERWYTLLKGLHEARAWHDFAKTLPNPDTVNTFLSRFFFQNMRVNGLREVLIKQIRKKLRELPAKKFPRDLGGQLVLDEFLIGTQIPWITDVSEPTVSANGEVGFDFNLLYKGGEGGFTLFFRLALEFLGFRVPHVVFSVKLIELEATVHISIGPPPSKKFWIGGHKPPILRLEVHQGCASGRGVLHRVLTSLPDLSGIMTNLIKLYLFSDMVLPYLDDFPLPSVVKSPKASLRDLRVRTFDRQRAAKISSAPVESSLVPAVTPVSPVRGPATEATPSKSKEGESSSNNSKSSPSTLHKSRESSFAATGAPGANAAAAVPVAPSPAPGAVLGQKGSSERSAATSQQQQQQQQSSVGTSPAPSERGRGDKTSQPTTPKGDGAATDQRDRKTLITNPSFTSRTVRDVASPITLTSPHEPSSGSFGTTQRGNAAANTSGLDPRNGTAVVPTTNSNSTPQHELLSEAELTESTDALSAATKKHGGSSSAVRNLKSLLKVKGKDMTRESVSRSKDKHKS